MADAPSADEVLGAVLGAAGRATPGRTGVRPSAAREAPVPRPLYDTGARAAVHLNDQATSATAPHPERVRGRPRRGAPLGRRRRRWSCGRWSGRSPAPALGSQASLHRARAAVVDDDVGGRQHRRLRRGGRSRTGRRRGVGRRRPPRGRPCLPYDSAASHQPSALAGRRTLAKRGLCGTISAVPGCLGDSRGAGRR